MSLHVLALQIIMHGMLQLHYYDAIMGAIASQITSLTTVY